MADDSITIVSPDGIIYEPRTSKQDAKLLAKAVRKGWAISDEMKAELPKTMMDIVKDEKCFAEVKVQAARALISMNQQNLDIDKADAGQPDHVVHHTHTMMPDLSRLTPQELIDLRNAARKLS